MSAGWVYVLINPSMPGLVKVGQTSRDPESRASELASVTGVATPFAVVFKEFFEDAVAAERYVHTLLADRRLNASREFFQADATTAIKAVMATPGQCAPFEEVGVDDDEAPVEDLGIVLFNQAMDHHYGTDTTIKQPAKAMQLYQQAASFGVSDAWISIGDMYLYGETVRPDARRAADFYHKAIEAGNFYGYARLAHALEDIDQADSDKAWELFFDAYLDNPDLTPLNASPLWFLSSFVFRMAIQRRHMIPAKTPFTALRPMIQEYIEERAQKETANKDFYGRMLQWLEDHPKC